MFETSVVAPYAFCTGVVFSVYGLLVAACGVSLTLAVLLLPLAWIGAFVVCRAVRGMPNSMSGVEKMTGPFMETPLARYMLVTMPLNHFGERVRFVLDLIDAPYEERNIAGILCIFLRGRSIPWLVDRLSCSHIGNSDQILHFIGASHVPALPPEKRAKAEKLLKRTDETIEWEEKLNCLGHVIQGFFYYYVLHLKMPVLFAITTWGAFDPRVPAAQRMLLRALACVLKMVMRDVFKLGGPGAEKLRDQRNELLMGILDDVDAALKRSGGPYMFGSELSYVDIGFSSLMYPLLDSQFMAPDSKWANGRFTSFSRYKAMRGDVTPAARFQVIREMEGDILKRPCGQLIQAVYRLRGAKL